MLTGYVGDVRCAECRRNLPAEAFLTDWERDREGRAWLRAPRAICARCAPPPRPLPCESGMRIAEIRGESGEPLRWRQRRRDGQFGQWRAMDQMELRRMAPGGNVFRPQPRRERAGRARTAAQPTTGGLF